MVDPTKYTDGVGQPWRQNTSYSKNKTNKGERKFNRAAIGKWKEVLSNEVLSLIDLFCCSEMLLHGYTPVTDLIEVKQSPNILDYEDEFSTLAEWIKPYASRYNNSKDIAAELQRIEIIKSQNLLSDKSKRLLVLEPSMYDILRRYS